MSSEPLKEEGKTMKQPDILFEEDGGIGWIRLNRPRVINVLTGEMMQCIFQQLELWKDQKNIVLICISGEGERGFCAGGDMLQLYHARDSNVDGLALDLFLKGYYTDFIIHHYPKPVLVWMDGIVMGGGAGIGAASSHRIVTERTKWAMPELNIGFIPDVGSSYFLNRLPGYTGRYLAMTSEVIRGMDLLNAGAAEFYFESGRWEELREHMKQINWSNEDTFRQMTDLLSTMQDKPTQQSELLAQREQIDQHFAYETVEEIIDSLEREAGKGNPWARYTVDILLSKPPTSLKVTLRQLQEGRNAPFSTCLQMELALSMNFIRQNDFYEGVRAVLVDKDRNPRWRPSRLENVDEQAVLSFFRYPWQNGVNPLSALIAGSARPDEALSGFKSPK
jgi:enoyl-CoA hydratase/carnithine racemase